MAKEVAWCHVACRPARPTRNNTQQALRIQLRVSTLRSHALSVKALLRECWVESEYNLGGGDVIDVIVLRA